ncbi:DedA family protein [Clostridium sp.]|uniref:DedA family protein n=1 Tax=Clostridium sp. TaxID=1506 RepID=UPI002603CCA1|nr:DedA family protein [Clostridium sp.]
MNNIQTVIQFLARYGLIFVFFIIFLEYLNFPGLGAAIVMPGIGIGVSEFKINIYIAILVSIIAAELASYILYYISYFCGRPLLTKVCNKFPKSRKPIDKTFHYIESYGYKGIFIGRLIPVARTLVPFVAGIFRMNIFKFAIYSILGTTIWNSVLIYAGYAFKNWFI